MKSIVHIFVCLVLTLSKSELLYAHGTPIILAPGTPALAVSGGLPGGNGYVSQFFAEDDEDGDGEVSPGPVPNIGNAILWEIPGINMSGLNTQSSLLLEVLAPAVQDNPTERRTVWYWNPDDGVVPAESSLYLLGSGLRNQTISPDDTSSLPPFLLVNEVGGTAAQGGQQGFHNHGLLTYALDNNSPPPPGAYGIFVRFTSNQYQPSNPFLIVLNHGVDYKQVFDAALAINAAAGDSLPGDFNADGAVDAADYVMWRKSISTAPDYETWAENFGIESGGGLARNLASPVPEPLAVQLVFGACIACTIATGLRTRTIRKTR